MDIDKFDYEMVKLQEEGINYVVDNQYNDIDGIHIWNFSSELQKISITDGVSEEQKIDKLLIQSDGIVIPSAASFSGDLQSVKFSSGWELCDSISGDLMCTYEVLMNNEGVLKKSILIELDIAEIDSFSAEIAIILDISYTDIKYLNTYLALFDTFKDGLPLRTCQIIAVLLNVNEDDSIKSFIDAHWKTREVDEQTIIAYRKM